MSILRNKYGEIRSGWDMLWVSFVILFGLQIVLAVFTSPFLSSSNGDPSFIMSLSINIIYEAVCIVVLLWIWRFYHKDNFINIGLTKKHRFGDLIIGLILGIVSIGCIYCILLITNQIQILSIDFSIVFTPRYILYIFFYILVGFWEELFSRGYFMSVLKRTRNIYAIIFLPALIFSLLHSLNPNVTFLGLTNIFLVGVLFAMMFYKRGSLWMPIGFHITWNFFQGNVFGLNVSGTDSYSIITNIIDGNILLTGGDFGAEGGLITTIVIFLLTMFFTFSRKKEEPILWNINI